MDDGLLGSSKAGFLSLLTCASLVLVVRVAGEACTVLNLFLSGCVEAAALRRGVDVVCFLSAPELDDCVMAVGLSLVVVGLFSVDREVVGLSTPDL